MSDLEQRVDAVCAYLLAVDPVERDKARANIRKMMNGNECVTATAADAETITRELLLELGSPDHLVGHPYAIRAILTVLCDRNYINNITMLLYPTLAAEFDTTASRVERAIRHLIEVTWGRGDLEVLDKYFGNTISAARGKPTNGEFIARMANIVNQRLRTSV